jgi:D-alanine-D-alanine ligase
VVPYTVLKDRTWRQELGAARVKISEFGGFPVFVKPAGQGSSVGVRKVRNETELEQAVENAFRFDTKVLIERAIDAREIEVSVLENREPTGRPLVSVPGEVVPSNKHEFYTYEAKYLDPSGARLMIPAPLEPHQRAEVQGHAGRAFEALLSEGMARVDFLMDKKSGHFFFNESNTIPGFTSISMYPKMWEASGLGYSDLLTRLVELALARYDRRAKIETGRD